jgi:integrase
LSCYDFHVFNGVDVGRDLHRIAHRGGGRYKPLLEHVARRKGRRQAVLTPEQIERICAACASWDPDAREWRGSVRNRLLWMLLAETGVRLGEALGLQHRDWHTGCGNTPFVEIVARDHPHAVRAKNGYRRATSRRIGSGSGDRSTPGRQVPSWQNAPAYSGGRLDSAKHDSRIGSGAFAHKRFQRVRVAAVAGRFHQSMVAASHPPVTSRT